ncbi:hypothetical protein AB0D10_41415 [Kitasatospora sp. NPDC048545]|uniref:YncE family protein n=1 Tax=Kitasatospora sp. NPDC048545 TaxID=3157208 RepID=UPI0033F999F5
MNLRLPKARWASALLSAAIVLGTGGAAGAVTNTANTANAAVSANAATVVSAANTVPAGGAKPPVGGVERLIPFPDATWTQRALISPDGRRAYVGEETRSGSRLDVVDTRTGAFLAQVPTGTDFWSGPKALAPDGKLLYLITQGTLNVFDTGTNTLRASVPVPDQPRPAGWTAGSPYGLAVSPDGATVYLGQSGPYLNSVPNPSFLPGRLLTFSAPGTAFTGDVPLPTTSPREIVVRPNGTTAYLSSPDGLIRVDLTGPRPAVVRTITAPGFIDELALAPNGTRLYALTRPDGRVQVIDLTTDSLAATIDLGTGMRQIPGFALSPHGDRLYVLEDTDLPSPTVAAYDTATNRPVPRENFAEFDLEHGSNLTVGPDSHTFYVTGNNYTDNPGTFLQIVSF